MGNNNSKPGLQRDGADAVPSLSSSSSPAPSPSASPTTARSNSRSSRKQQQQHFPSRREKEQPNLHHPNVSRGSNISAVLTNVDSNGSPASENPSHTPYSTLSPISSHSLQHHIRTLSIEYSPAYRARGEGSMGNSQSTDSWREKEARKRDREQDPQSSPVQVPPSGQQRRSRGPSEPMEASGPPHTEDYVPKSNLNFPPRLPLPIQEEVYTPGSPIITPEDLSSALQEGETNGALPHRTSLLSHTTVDDEEEVLEYEPDATSGKTVPTVIEWRGHAEKVYITGTFAAWSRKYRMHRDPNDPELLSTKLDLRPGTHHVKFIVDGEMQLSNDLPTAVDYTNILVNYIEVSADDIPLDTPKEERPDHLHPPLVIPAGIQETDFAQDAVTRATKAKEQKFLPVTAAHYSDIVPAYLSDLDRDEQSNRFRRSANHVADIPAPPSLPLFLGKSILNGTTPMKDDSSVLNMPNHTVLNHLATSSIKNEVLATSLTTRYKRKYVTTITYRPTKEDD